MKIPPLFLVTKDNDNLGRHLVGTGKMKLRGKESLGAHDANTVAYWRLTSSCADYLEQARLWPVEPYGAIVLDKVWSDRHKKSTRRCRIPAARDRS